MRFVRLLLCAAALAPNASGPAVAAPAQSKEPRYVGAEADLAARKAQKANKKPARNVIIFIGDGMDPTTVAASRIYDGQTRGEEGEENFLSFEKFPNLAMSKTYNTNAQTPDSAGTMSAMMTGVKTKMGVISLTDAAEFGNCASAKGAVPETLAELAEKAGMATGVVTTARLTHATPAAVYAHTPERNWEADSNLTEEAVANGCHDIARQLLEFAYGDGLEVAMGGGRTEFLPAETADPEHPEFKGLRRDGRDLTKEWVAKGAGSVYVTDEKSFKAVDPQSTKHLLGLFEPSHMQFELDRSTDIAGEPSLAEMTEKAIQILSKNKAGYFLMVEAGRIDHAHHAGNAARALKDAQALSEAVAKARAKTSERDTLVIVTADHGHTLTFAGYPKKGNNILGLATATIEDTNQKDGYSLASDGKPYTTLSYANGPGSILLGQKKAGERPTITEEEAIDPAFRQPSLVPSAYETHGGQDVTIYASGPHAYLFTGVVEQNYIFHVINDALGLDKRVKR